MMTDSSNSEVWLPIVGHTGYEVSNLGNVRSINRCVPRGNHVLNLKGKLLHLIFVKTNGYYRVHLRHPVLVHRLVALAFCDGYAQGLQVNHKNGIRTDNRAENLEWVTPSRNIQHSYDILGRVGAAIGTSGETAPASKAVVSIDRVTGKSKRWASASDAARAGFDASCISACCNGARTHHKGQFWKFSD